MSSSAAKTYDQKLKTPGQGAGEAPHPFAVAVEASQDESLIPEGYGIKYNAYHTITEGVFLPTGTILPGGAVFTMSSVLDFPTWLPPGTKIPGGLVTPVSMQEPPPPPGQPKPEEVEPICLIM
ncbi:hypothetical protein HD553DRAFT_339569 [Filobasidium floriforme]|uniref:uncharacterized protein n=1 Tax=Filobasidium floriforme TaxID=5210 RepID=UPI001E8CD179|nr:uncharacterized protein HD553DRAFT_339569 [Filobasidium floriforme]KAH8089358.1 hypothetical protein HD553DRAFT_339569 [Filobasidium floriforme]